MVLAPLWVYGGIYILQQEKKPLEIIGQKVGMVPEIEYVSGTGSMFPTFPKGKGKTSLERMQEIVGKYSAKQYPGGVVINGQRYGGYQLQRGDIVFFANDKTKEIQAKESSNSSDINAGFVKRLIALPGDKIEIRDGFVKINGKFADEPYIDQAKSTYGGNFLSDCTTLTIPQNYIFVMGDNRKASNDSRFDLGLVQIPGIRTVIPVNEQDNLKAHFRNTSRDLEMGNQPIFNIEEYLKLLNIKRQEAGIQPLALESKLSESAQKRAEIIIKYNDTSFEASRSGYTMKKAMAEAGYSNITWGEVPAVGYYESEELVDNFFQFPDSKKFLLKSDFSETGIAASVGEINGCPVQVVVQHLAGYVPPNYPQKAIDNWGGLIDNLYKVIPTWEKAKNDPEINQDDLNKLIGLLYRRKNNAEKIYNRMKANEWLSGEEEKLVEEDDALFQQTKALADKLNSR